jgi:hypothetical protein
VVSYLDTLLNTIDYSKLLDDVVIRAKLVLSEKLVNVLRGLNVKGLDDLVKKYSDGIYRFSIESPSIKYNLLIYKGYIIGALLENNVKKYGVEALNDLMRNTSSFSIKIFSIPSSIFEEIIGSDNIGKIEDVLRRKSETISREIFTAKPMTQTTSRTSPTETARVVRVEKISFEKIRREIYELVERMGFDIINVGLEQREEIIYLVIDLAPIPQLMLDLESLLYAALSLFIEKTKMFEGIIKAEARMGSETRSKVLVKREDYLASIILGKIIRILNDNYVPITSSQYQVVDHRLEIIIDVKKPAYPGVKIDELVKKIYGELRKIWGNELTILIRKGRFSKIRIP